MKKSLLTFLLLFSLNLAHSQSILSPASKNGPKPDFKTEKEAEKVWKSGDYAEAEKLYRKAYANGGYVLHLMPLAKKKFEIGDVKGANAIYDIIIKDQTEYVKGKPQVYRTTLNFNYFEKIENNFKKGSPEVGIATTLDFLESMGDKVTDSERGFFQGTYTSACESAFALDDENSLLKLNEKASRMEKGEYGEFLSYVYLNLVRKDYQKALDRIDHVMEGGGGFFMSKAVAKSLYPVVYTTMGENEKALEAINKSKSNILIGDGYYQYLYGVVALNQKKYPEAIEHLTKAIKGYMVLYVRVEPAGKYKHYTKRAEAYLGLGDLIQAKKVRGK